MKLFDFFGKYRTRTFSKGELLLNEGDIPGIAYVLKRGIVKTYSLTNEGQEKPVGFHIPYEIFPTGWTFFKIRRNQFFHEAITDCEVYCIPREDFIDQLSKDLQMMQNVFDYVLRRFLDLQTRIVALEQSKAADKVLRTLHFFSLRFGRDVKKNVVRIQLPLTQQDLANFMGLTRETTGIELKKLERAGIISYKHQNYLVHTDKLNERLDENYDDDRLIDDEPHVITA